MHSGSGRGNLFNYFNDGSIMIIVNARFLTQRVTGVQRFAIEISKILRNLNDQIIFVTHIGILDLGLAAQLGAIIIGKNKGTIWEQIDLRRYLARQHQPLLVNFCNSGLICYKRQMITIHDMSYKVNPQWFSRSFYLWYNFLIPNIANNSLKIFTVSNSAKNDIINYLNVDAGKISVIYNSSYLNTNDNFGTLNKEKYILTISTLDPRKNLENLVRAFDGINEKVKLIIVGTESNVFSSALDKTLLNKNIILKGHVSDQELAILIKNAEIFVYLSLYEGFGLPPIEAMGIGCPVLVSDITAHREVCAAAALYANPYDVNDIKDKITTLLNDESLKNELVKAGEKNIKRFSWFKSASKVLSNINEIV